MSRIVRALTATALGVRHDVLLLLRATSDGDGRFAGVTFIHRLDTRGGAAPASTCDPEQQPTLAVPYLAVYYFFGATP